MRSPNGSSTLRTREKFTNFLLRRVCYNHYRGKYTALYVAEIEEPETLKDALDSEYATQWKAAADAEYQPRSQALPSF
jgi:hypothetical protein